MLSEYFLKHNPHGFSHKQCVNFAVISVLIWTEAEVFFFVPERIEFIENRPSSLDVSQKRTIMSKSAKSHTKHLGTIPDCRGTTLLRICQHTLMSVTFCL